MRVQEALKKKDLQQKAEKNKVLSTSRTIIIKEKGDTPKKNLSQKFEESPIFTAKIGHFRKTALSQISTDVPRISKTCGKLKMFSLDYAVAQTIRSNFNAFKQQNSAKNLQKKKKAPILLENRSKPVTGKHTEIDEIITKYKQNAYLKKIMSKYRLSFERLDSIVKQFIHLNKVSLYLKTHKGNEKDTPRKLIDPKKEEIMIERLLGLTNVVSEDLKGAIEYKDYGELKADINVIKIYFKKLREMNNPIFRSILLALDINPEKNKEINMDTFCKLRYYLLDMHATSLEYIYFGLKFLNPNESQETDIKEIIKLLRLLLIWNEEDNAKMELLIQALISNFVLCGILDDQGKFHREVFQDVYRKNKMNIMSLIKIILS